MSLAEINPNAVMGYTEVLITSGCTKRNQKVWALRVNGVPNGTASCSNTPGTQTTISGRQCLKTTCPNYNGYR